MTTYKLVALPGLGVGEVVWVNPDQVGAIIPISQFQRPPNMPSNANSQVIVSGQGLLFPGKVAEIMAALYGKPIIANA